MVVSPGASVGRATGCCGLKLQQAVAVAAVSIGDLCHFYFQGIAGFIASPMCPDLNQIYEPKKVALTPLLKYEWGDRHAIDLLFTDYLRMVCAVGIPIDYP